MHTIVGLGNPGDEYTYTRHNIGWLVLDEIRKAHGLADFLPTKRYEALITEGNIEGEAVAMLLPTTFMNNSGSSVAKFLKEKGQGDTLIVVHDDVDLGFGDCKVSVGRGAGGHNGVRSVMSVMGETPFIRIRIGIAKKGFFGGVKRPKGEDLGDFVLKNFSSSEKKEIGKIGEKVDMAISLILSKGVQFAMQECNK